MARISKYVNQYTENSLLISETFRKEALNITLEKVEELQFRYGISNVLLCESLKISLSVLSKWKNEGTMLPDYYKISIYSYFKHIEAKS
jgi:hypothetical protein